MHTEGSGQLNISIQLVATSLIIIITKTMFIEHFHECAYNCDSPNRPTYGVFLNLFTFLLTYLLSKDLKLTDERGRASIVMC